jgi:hypothetical protein
MATLMPSMSSDEEDNTKRLIDDDDDDDDDSINEGQINEDFLFGGILVSPFFLVLDHEDVMNMNIYEYTNTVQNVELYLTYYYKNYQSK